MFKGLRTKKERFDFRFRFHATRVPASGFDNLVVFVVPADSGKPEGQTPKATVKNGSCAWSGSVTITTKLTRHAKAKAYEPRPYRFVVSSATVQCTALDPRDDDESEHEEVPARRVAPGAASGRHGAAAGKAEAATAAAAAAAAAAAGGGKGRAGDAQKQHLQAAKQQSEGVKQAQKQEAQRQEAQRKEAQRQEAQRQEAQRQEARRQETEAASQPVARPIPDVPPAPSQKEPSSSVVRSRDTSPSRDATRGKGKEKEKAAEKGEKGARERAEERQEGAGRGGEKEREEEDWMGSEGERRQGRKKESGIDQDLEWLRQQEMQKQQEEMQRQQEEMRKQQEEMQRQQQLAERKREEEDAGGRDGGAEWGGQQSEEEELRRQEEALEEEARRVRMEREKQRQRKEEMRRQQQQQGGGMGGASADVTPAQSPALQGRAGGWDTWGSGAGDGRGEGRAGGGEREPARSPGIPPPAGAAPVGAVSPGKLLGGWSKRASSKDAQEQGAGGPDASAAGSGAHRLPPAAAPAVLPPAPGAAAASPRGARTPSPAGTPTHRPARQYDDVAGAEGGGMGMGGGGESSPYRYGSPSARMGGVGRDSPGNYRSPDPSPGMMGAGYPFGEGGGGGGEERDSYGGGGGSSAYPFQPGAPPDSLALPDAASPDDSPRAGGYSGSRGARRGYFGAEEPAGRGGGGGAGGGQGAEMRVHRDSAGELAAAEAAIEELQRDCVKYQTTARNLSREVESLRGQLAEAFVQDQRADMAIGQLKDERDRLQEEVNMLRAGLGGRGGGGGLSGGAGEEEGMDTNSYVADGTESEWSVGGGGGGGAEGMRRVAGLLEEAEFLRGTVGALSAQVEMLQRENEALMAQAEQAEAEAGKYRRDAEELFEARQETEAALKRAQKQADEREAEWQERARAMAEAQAALEEQLAELQGAEGWGGGGSARPSPLGPRGKGEGQEGVEDGLMLSETVGMSGSSRKSRGGSGGDGEAGGEGERGAAGDVSVVAQLRRKVEELEREAQELTAESLELAAGLNVANKEGEVKDALIEQLQHELIAAGKKDSIATAAAASGFAAFFSKGKAEGKSVESLINSGPAANERDVGKLHGRIVELLQALKEQSREAEEAREEAVQLRSKMRVSEMATARAMDRLSILEEYERRAKQMEGELEETRKTLAAQRRLREEQERRHVGEVEQLREGKRDAENRVTRYGEEVRRLERQGEGAVTQVEQVGETLRAFFAAWGGEKGTGEEGETLGEQAEGKDVAGKVGVVVGAAAQWQQRVGELEREREALEEQVRESDARVHEVESTSGAWRSDRGALEKQVRRLDEQRRLAESRVQEVELQLSAMQEMLEEAKAEAGAAAAGGSLGGVTLADVEALQAANQKARRRIHELEGQVRGLEERAREKEAELEVALAAVSAAADSAAAAAAAEAVGRAGAGGGAGAGAGAGGAGRAERELEDARRRVEGLEEEIKRMSGELALAGVSRRELEMKVLRLEGACGKLESELQEANVGRRRAEERQAEVEAQLAVAVDRAETQRGLVGELEAKVSKGAAREEALEQYVAVVEGKVKEAERERERLEGRVREEEEKRREVEKRVGESEAAVGRAREEAEREVGEARRMVEEMEARLEVGEAERESAVARAVRAEEGQRREKAEREAAVERLTNEVALLTQQLSALSEGGSGGEGGDRLSAVEAAELRAAKGELEDKLRRAEGDLRETVREKVKLEGEVRAAKESAAESKVKEGSLLGEVEELKRQVAVAAEAAAELTRVREQHEQVVTQLVKAEASVKELQVAREELEQERKGLVQQSVVLQGKVKELERVKGELAQARTERQVLEERRLALAMKLARIEESMEELEDLRARSASVEGEMGHLAKQAEQVPGLMEEREKLQGRVRELEGQAAELEARVGEMEAAAAAAAAVAGGGESEGDGDAAAAAATAAAAEATVAAEAAAAAAAAKAEALVEEVRQLKQQNAELKRALTEGSSSGGAGGGGMEPSPQGKGSRSLGGGAGGLGGMGGGGGAGGAFARGRMGGIMASRGGGGEAALEKQVEELRRRTVALEGEVGRKAEALAAAERRLLELEGSGGSGGGGAGARVGDMDVAAEERIKTLEAQVEGLQQQVEQQRAVAEAREGSMGEYVALLTATNDSLAAGTDAATMQLNQALLKAQQQVGQVKEREAELRAAAAVHDATILELKEEVGRLQKKLSQRMRGGGSTAGGSGMVERMALLEAELAEAIESNHKYKDQLKRALGGTGNGVDTQSTEAAAAAPIPASPTKPATASVLGNEAERSPQMKGRAVSGSPMSGAGSPMMAGAVDTVTESRYGDLDALPADVWLRIANEVVERDDCCCSWPLVSCAIALPCVRRALSGDEHLVFYEKCECVPAAVSLAQRIRSFAWLTKQHQSPSQFIISINEAPPRLLSSLMRSCLFPSISSITSLDLYFSQSLPSHPRLLFSLSQAPRLKSLDITHDVALDSESDIQQHHGSDPVMVAEMWEIISIMEEKKASDKDRSFPVLRHFKFFLPACSPLVLRFVSCISSQLDYPSLGGKNQFVAHEGEEEAERGENAEGPRGRERDVDGRDSLTLHLPQATNARFHGISCSISLSAPRLSALCVLWKSPHFRLLLLPTCPAHLPSLFLSSYGPCEWPLQAPHLMSLESLCTNMQPEQAACFPPGVIATVKALEWRYVKVSRPLVLPAWHGLRCFHAMGWDPVSLWMLRFGELWPCGVEGLFFDHIGSDVGEILRSELSEGLRHGREGTSSSQDDIGLGTVEGGPEEDGSRDLSLTLIHAIEWTAGGMHEVVRHGGNDTVLVAQMWELISVMEDKSQDDTDRPFPVFSRLDISLPVCSPLVLRFISCLSAQLHTLYLVASANHFAAQEGEEGAENGTGNADGWRGRERDMHGGITYSLDLPLATDVILDKINCSISLSAPRLSDLGFYWHTRHSRLLLLPTCPVHLTALFLNTKWACPWGLHVPHPTSLESLCTNMHPEQAACLPPGEIATVKRGLRRGDSGESFGTRSHGGKGTSRGRGEMGLEAGGCSTVAEKGRHVDAGNGHMDQKNGKRLLARLLPKCKSLQRFEGWDDGGCVLYVLDAAKGLKKVGGEPEDDLSAVPADVWVRIANAAAEREECVCSWPLLPCAIAMPCLHSLDLAADDQFAAQEGEEGPEIGEDPRERDVDGRTPFSLHLPLATDVRLGGLNCSISLSAPCLSSLKFRWQCRHSRLLLLPTCPTHLSSLFLTTDPTCPWALHAPHLTSLHSLCIDMDPEQVACFPSGVIATVKVLEWRCPMDFRSLDLSVWHGLRCLHAVGSGPVPLSVGLSKRSWRRTRESRSGEQPQRDDIMWPFGSSDKQQALPLRHEGGRSYYDVQPGDNLTKIAGQLGSTVEILMQANALRSDLLHPGQSLWVPRTYTIAKGDTLYAIARMHGTTVDAIMQINNIQDANLIHAGEVSLDIFSRTSPLSMIYLSMLL
ncbi:unnamed protein product [Closterium sp. NIES-64]|nr:unnamed protein product [Closterium sp. NIES-64]